MWTVIYVSQSIETAKKLIDVLLTNKVISKLRRTNNCNGNESSCYGGLTNYGEQKCKNNRCFNQWW